MSTKKYQVFISSTYQDLIKERAVVSNCLLDNNCIPVGMEQFPASNMSQMEYIKKMMADCDYYILILAGRYGSLDNDGIGFTEKEYDYALKCKIPVLSFLISDINALPRGMCESEESMNLKLARFREKVCNGRLVKFYSNADELRSHVITSVNRCISDSPARGWVRGAEIIPQEKETPHPRIPESLEAAYGLLDEDLASDISELFCQYQRDDLECRTPQILSLLLQREWTLFGIFNHFSAKKNPQKRLGDAMLGICRKADTYNRQHRRQYNKQHELQFQEMVAIADSVRMEEGIMEDHVTPNLLCYALLLNQDSSTVLIIRENLDSFDFETLKKWVLENRVPSISAC